MIEWLRRVEPDRPFLHAGERVWSYGESVARVEAGISPEPVVVRPRLDPDSVFDIISGVSGGGVCVVGTDGEPVLSGGALTVLTSGSTGAPRPIGLSTANLAAAAAASAEHLGHGPEDNWLLAMPLRHVGGLSILFRQAYSGGSVTLLPGFDPESFAAAMRGRVTMVSVVAAMLRRLLPFGPFDGLRAVLVGGGPIPEGLLEEAVGLGLPALPTYGMTETFGQVATLRPGSPLQYAVEALPGVELAIGDDHRIAIRGAQVSEDVVDSAGWFVTTDLGEIDEAGMLRVLGRSDTVIVTGGVNVQPEKIESVLAPFAEEVVVVGAPDDEWGEMVVCVYVGAVDLETIARDKLEGPFRPKRYVRVAEIPRTTLGKPDRSLVIELI